MRRMALGFAIVLLALPLAAAVGPERRLSASATSLFDSVSAAYDGAGYTVIWARTDTNARTAIAYARLTEDGDVLTQPKSLVVTEQAERPAVASNGTNTLLTWIERPQDSPVRYMGAWLNGEGDIVDTPFEISNAATRNSAAIDVTNEELGFVVAISGDNFIRILSFDALGRMPTKNQLISDDWASDVRVSFSDGALVAAWDENFIEQCGVPTGCIRTRPKARLFDFQLGTPVGGELALAGNDVTSLVSIDNGFAVSTGGLLATQFVVTRISRSGVIAGNHIEPFRYLPSLATLGGRLYTGFHRGAFPQSANLYFLPFDAALRPILAPGQAYTITSSARNEDSLTITSGRRNFLAAYFTTEAANVHRQESESFLAYRIIDPLTMPPLPAAPSAPTLVAGTTQNAPSTVRIGWTPRPGTKIFRVEIISEDGLDRRDVAVAGNVTEATIDVLRNGIYQFRLIVEDEVGFSVASEPLRVEVPTKATPPPPPPKKRAVRRG